MTKHEKLQPTSDTLQDIQPQAQKEVPPIVKKDILVVRAKIFPGQIAKKVQGLSRTVRMVHIEMPNLLDPSADGILLQVKQDFVKFKYQRGEFEDCAFKEFDLLKSNEFFLDLEIRLTDYISKKGNPGNSASMTLLTKWVSRSPYSKSPYRSYFVEPVSLDDFPKLTSYALDHLNLVKDS